MTPPRFRSFSPLWAGVLAGLLLTAGGCSNDGPVGKKAPGFLVSPLKPGGDVTLADFKGKVVLLDFWATWCGPCRQLMPFIAQMHEKYQGKGLAVMGISGEERPLVERFSQVNPEPYDFFLDHNYETTRLYGSTELPTIVLVDKQGNIRAYDHGYNDETLKNLEETINNLLSE